MAKDTVVCDRVWLLYLQGRLSPSQLLALCKLAAENKDYSQEHPAPSV